MNEELLRNVLRIIKNRPEHTETLIDSFSDNQFLAKDKLVNAVSDILHSDMKVTIMGSWYGSILIPRLYDKVKRIECIDIDDSVIGTSKTELFRHLDVGYTTGDVFSNYYACFKGANLLINTSCEHMKPMKDWPFWEEDQYFAFTSNNMYDIEGHINCVETIDDFIMQLPPSDIIHEEVISDSRGDRFLVVGRIDA